MWFNPPAREEREEKGGSDAWAEKGRPGSEEVVANSCRRQKVQREGCWKTFVAEAKRELGVDKEWLGSRARTLVPLVDRLNHIGEFVRGLEDRTNESEVSEILANVADALCEGMAKVSKREELPFTESTFRNFIRRFPAFEHKESDPKEITEGGESEKQTDKLMSWLKL